MEEQGTNGEQYLIPSVIMNLSIEVQAPLKQAFLVLRARGDVRSPAVQAELLSYLQGAIPSYSAVEVQNAALWVTQLVEEEGERRAPIHQEPGTIAESSGIAAGGLRSLDIGARCDRSRRGPDTPFIAPNWRCQYKGGFWLPCERDRIVVNSDALDLEEVCGTRVREVLAINGIFSVDGKYMRVVYGEGAPRLEELVKPQLKTLLCYAFRCETVQGRQGETAKPATFSEALLSAISGSAEHYALPVLKYYSHIVLAKDGRWLTETGYDERTKTLVLLHPDVEFVAAPKNPTVGQVAEALAVLKDFLHDVPFKEDSDRVNFLAYVLAVLMRPHVGRIPALAVTKNCPGAGASHAISVVTELVLGNPAKLVPANGGLMEQRKELVSFANASFPAISFDNIAAVKGAALAAFLTADNGLITRRLGGNTVMEVSTEMLLIFNGIDMKVDKEQKRRLIPVRLHVTGERLHTMIPENGFRHEDLRGYMRENRRELMAALMTLINTWLARDCPLSKKKQAASSSVAFVEKLGGLFEVCGIEGFMENAEAFFAEAVEEDKKWPELVTCFYAAFEGRKFTAAEAVSVLQRGGFVAEELQARNPAQAMGIALQKLDNLGAAFGGFRVIRDRKSSNSRQYRLVRVGIPSTLPAPKREVDDLDGLSSIGVGPASPPAQTMPPFAMPIISASPVPGALSFAFPPPAITIPPFPGVPSTQPPTEEGLRLLGSAAPAQVPQGAVAPPPPPMPQGAAPPPPPPPVMPQAVAPPPPMGGNPFPGDVV